MVVRLAISGCNKGSVDHLMMQKAIADRVHSLVGNGTSSTTVVSNVCSLLADQSQRYYRARTPRADLFTADAHPNISVFDSLMVHSLLCVLGRYGDALPLVSELASAIVLSNGNDTVHHSFDHQ